MSLTTSEMTPADIAAVTNNSGNCNDGWGGGWASWIILFLIFGMFGWGGYGGFGGGFGGNAGASGALTRADLCQDMNFNQLENGVRGIQQGICDSTFALNNSINGAVSTLGNSVNSLATNVMQGFHGVDNAVCNLGYQTQQGFNATQVAMMQGQNALQTQLADCCCTTQRAIDGVNYNAMANTTAIQNTLCNSTRDIIESQNSGTRAILDALTAQRIEAKDQRIAEQAQTIAQLQLSASQDRQNALLTTAMANQTNQVQAMFANQFPQARPAYVVPNPNGCYNASVQFGNSCGNSCC